MQSGLETRLAALAGQPIRVHIRRAGEIAALLRNNPCPHAPGNHAMAILLDHPPTPEMLQAAKNQAPNECLALGHRELHV